MHKRCEELIDKHLTKMAGCITLEVCEKNFDRVFKEVCDQGSPNDTTIGATYRRLEKMAIEAVNVKFEEYKEEVTSEMGIVKSSPHGNPFALIAYELWENFLYYYDIRGLVESFIGDEWSEKQVKMTKSGILDEHGDIKR